MNLSFDMVVVSLNRARFFNFVIYSYLLCAATSSDSSHVGVNVDNFYYQKCIPKNYDDDNEMNHSCGKNIRITSLTSPFTVGEGPFWSTKKKSLYLVDGARSMICRYAVHTKQLFCAKLGNESVQFIIPFLDCPGKFMTSYGGYLVIVSWDSTSKEATFQSLRHPDQNPKHFVNDAKAGFSGDLFFVTEPKVPPTGLGSVPPNQSQLYHIINGEQILLLADLSFGNGIGLSCDEKSIYVSDSITNCTYSLYHDRTTDSIKYKRVLLHKAYLERGCFPDSMTVDTKGYIWTTCNRGSQILKVEPHTGKIMCSIRVPAVAPTNVAFGECPGKPNNILNCLYFTSERIRLSSPTPLDGVLFVIENTGSEGYPPNEVKLSEFNNRMLGGCGSNFNFES